MISSLGAAMADKLLITDNSAVTAKYGAAGLQSSQTAIANLVAADQGQRASEIAADEGHTGVKGICTLTH
jgi:hypothetical protein